MRRAPVAAVAAATVATALSGVAPAGIGNADICGGFGPGVIISGNCGPSDNNAGTDASSQSGDSSWPPAIDYGSDDDGGGTPAAPIVPVSPAP
ncbi:MAG: hypothetical protein JO330_07705 [Mycobacteriaceae bacterium]|nr:hypothetical protein [Mycobacteriaceae bacterium]